MDDGAMQYHRAVQGVRRSESALVHAHGALLKRKREWLTREEALHRAALAGDDTQHNVDDYVAALESLVSEQTQALQGLQSSIAEMREGLQAELAASQKVQSRVYY